MLDIITELYCDVDDFCKNFKKYLESNLENDSRLLEDKSKKNRFYPVSGMELSEILTIIIAFHLSGYRTFKYYYIRCVQNGELKSYFPKTVSYNRFVELMSLCVIPMTLYTAKNRLGECSGISFVDSTRLEVCHNCRIHSHKVFKGAAKRGKTSVGWFYGFKLHLVINHSGEILSFCLTPGNVSDVNLEVMRKLTKSLFGKLFGDKGYLSSKLFEELYNKNITLITKIRKNMKNKLMDLFDKVLLRKRAVIESVNNFLKNICQIEHTRHRSPINFLVNLVAGLCAYSFLPNSK